MADDSEGRLDEVIADYLQAEEAGDAPGRDELMRRHPELADHLRSFFGDLDRVRREAAPFRDAEASGPVPLALRDFGGYELLAELGRGGMGVVYRARQKSTGRLVALKMVLTGPLATAEDRERFRREGRAVIGLDHPRIAPVYEAGEHAGRPYYTMELFEGGDLRRLLGRPGSPVVSALLVRLVARAVHHAHQRGVLHRDLKPANILLDEEGRPHVADFGLARRLGDESGLTESGAIVGTLAYMAPEQALGEKHLTTAADVYSLGAILYALLTGRPPFQGTTVFATLRGLTVRVAAGLRARNPKVSRDLETVCLKCLEADPARRYGSAAELADDLERFLRGEPVVARRTSSLVRAARWLRRRPAAAALLGLAVTALAAAGFSAVEHTRRLDRARQAAERAAARADNQAEDERVRAALSRAEADRWQGASRGDRMTAQLLRVAAVRGRSRDLARELLNDPDACPFDLRDFAWNLLDHGVTHQLDTEPRVGDSPFVFRPDGRVLAGSSGKGGVKLWNVATGQMVASLNAHEWLNELAFRADGKLLVTTGGSGARLWDGATGAEVATLEHPGRHVGKAVFSPDGSALLTRSWATPPPPAGTLYELDLWDVATHTLRATLPFDPNAYAFSPDGKLLALGEGDHEATLLIDVATGREVGRTEPSQNTNTIGQIAFSRDGRLLATEGFKIDLWDVATLKRRARLDAAGTSRLDFTPDGTALIAGSRPVVVWDVEAGRERFTIPEGRRPFLTSDGTALVAQTDCGIGFWDIRTGRLRVMLRGRFGEVSPENLSPDGATLADGRIPISLWDVRTGQVRLVLDELAWVFSPDGRALAGRDGHHIRLLVVPETDHLARLYEHDGRPVEALEFSPDGKLLAVGGDAAVRLRDSATGETRGTFVGFEPYQHSNLQGPERAVAVAFGGSGRVLAAGGSEGTVLAWNVADGRPLLRAWRTYSQDVAPGRRQELVRSRFPVHAVAVSPDGTLVAAASWASFTAWDVASGKELLTGGADEWGCLAFSPAGDTLAVGAGKFITLWDVAGRKLRRTSNWPEEVTALAFGADGAQVVVGSSSGAIGLFDIATGAVKEGAGRRFASHPPAVKAPLPDDLGHGRANFGWGLPPTNNVFRLEIGAGDTLLLSASAEEVRLDEVATGRQLRRLTRAADDRTVFTAAAVSPDGRLIATGDTQGVVTLWKGTAERPLGANDAEDRAADAVKRWGGAVRRDDKLPSHPVIEVDLADTGVTDADLKELAAFTGLRQLFLPGGKVTGVGLEHLAPLKNLAEIDLGRESLTDSHLRALRKIGLLHTLREARAKGWGANPARKTSRSWTWRVRAR